MEKKHEYVLSASSSLDSKKTNRNNFCGRWSVEGQFTWNARQQWRYASLLCKSWTCPRCGPIKAQRLRKSIARVASEKGLQRFLTLTLDPVNCTPAESVAYIRNCFNKFRTSLKRQCGTSVRYISVLELQKSGYAHLHVLVDRFIEQKWISRAWEAVGGGSIVHIKFVDVHHIAPYLTKYLTKDLLLAAFKPRQRRYSTSRDIRLFDDLSAEGLLFREVSDHSGIRETSAFFNTHLVQVYRYGQCGDTWSVIKVPLKTLYGDAREIINDEYRNPAGVIEWFHVPKPVWRPHRLRTSS